MAYLGWRLPLTVNVSPAIVYPQQPIYDTESFLRSDCDHQYCTVYILCMTLYVVFVYIHEWNVYVRWLGHLDVG